MGDIKTRIYWLMGLRVVVVTLLLGLSLAFQVTKGERVETFYALIVFTYGATILYAVVLRKLSSSQALVQFTWVQITIRRAADRELELARAGQ